MIRPGGTNDVGGHKLKDGMMDGPKMARGCTTACREVTVEIEMNPIQLSDRILCSCNAVLLVAPTASQFRSQNGPDFLETACVLKKWMLHTDFFLRASCWVSDNVVSRFCRITLFALFALTALIPQTLSKCLYSFNSVSNCPAKTSQPIFYRITEC